MLLDFHIHAFPDDLAPRALEKLSQGGRLTARTDGTVSGTAEKLQEWRIDKGLLLPIATKPSQQTKINQWAADVQAREERLLAFGSVHPDAPDALAELEKIKKSGLKGIKLHPDFQDFFIDDEKAFPIYEKCAQLGLIIVFHTGEDPVSPDRIHATPAAAGRVLDTFPRLIAVLAHMGGMHLWDEVETHLIGRPVYFDTAFVAGEISDSQMLRMIRRHGAEKILFASDCPWSSPVSEIDLLKRLHLTDSEMEQIFWTNAQKLLQI